jgi:hypothetical protein
MRLINRNIFYEALLQQPIMRVALGACVVLALVVGVLANGRTLAAKPAGDHYQLRAGDDVAPADERYQQALRLGLAGKSQEAHDRFVTLSGEARGTSLGAWSLYQASIGAKLLKQDPLAEAHVAQLRSDYADHPLTGRLAEPAPTPRPQRRSSDCGPRALLYLCERAGIAADLQELTRLCKTDKQGTTLARMQTAARQKGFQAEAAHVDAAFLQKHRPSGIAWFSGDHYVAFLPDGGAARLLVYDANETQPEALTPKALAKRCQGIVLLMAWGEGKLPPLGR